MDPPLPQWFYDMDVVERVILAARLPPRNVVRGNSRGGTPPPPYSEAWDMPVGNPPGLGMSADTGTDQPARLEPYEGRGLSLGRMRGPENDQRNVSGEGRGHQLDLDSVARHIFGDLDSPQETTAASNPWLLPQPRLPPNIFWEDMLEEGETLWGEIEEAAEDEAIQLELSDSSMNELLIMTADLSLETLRQEEERDRTVSASCVSSTSSTSSASTRSTVIEASLNPEEVDRDLEFITQLALYVDDHVEPGSAGGLGLARLTDTALEEIDHGVQRRAADLYTRLGRPPAFPGLGMRRDWRGQRPSERHEVVRNALGDYFAESAVATAQYATRVADVVQDREALILHDALVWEAARARRLRGDDLSRTPEPREMDMSQSRRDRVEAALIAREERAELEQAWHAPDTELDNAIDILIQNPGSRFFHHSQPSRAATFDMTGTTLRPNSEIITEGMAPPARLTRPKLVAGRRLAYDPAGREHAEEAANEVIEALLLAAVPSTADEAEVAVVEVDGAAALPIYDEGLPVYGPLDRPRLLAPPPPGLTASGLRQIRRQQLGMIPLYQRFGDYHLGDSAMDSEFVNSARERVKFWATCSACGTRNGVRDSRGVLHHHHHKRECPTYLLRAEVKRTCFYELCDNNTEHRTSVCPVLHRFCRPGCRRRGHCHGQCHLGLDLEGIFEKWASSGRYTRTGGCWGFLGPQTDLDDLRFFRAGPHGLWMDWPHGVDGFVATSAEDRVLYMNEAVRN